MRCLRGLLCLVLMLTAPPVWAAKHAFVLGNAAYRDLSDLRNTREDAKAYRAAFEALGFAVHYHEDLDLDATFEAFDAFLLQIAPGDEVAFVYSGHGWSDGQANYLIPTDAPKGGNDRQLQRQTVALRNGLNGVLDELERAGAGLTVAVIDACRNNPFQPPQGRKSLGLSRGLAPIKGAVGTFVVFSAGEGQEALDRLPEDGPDQRLSVFTRTFAPLLASGMYLEDAISKAQVDTAALARQANGHVQHPAYYDQTLGDTCLSGSCRQGLVAQPQGQCDQLFEVARSESACFAYSAFAEHCASHVMMPLAKAFLTQRCEVETVAHLDPVPPKDDPGLATTFQSKSRTTLLAELDALKQSKARVQLSLNAAFRSKNQAAIRKSTASRNELSAQIKILEQQLALTGTDAARSVVVYSAEILEQKSGFRTVLVVGRPETRSWVARNNLKRGDVISEVGGQVLSSAQELQKALSKTRRDGAISIKVFRDGKELSFSVKL